jgi:hypothetical protein
MLAGKTATSKPIIHQAATRLVRKNSKRMANRISNKPVKEMSDPCQAIHGGIIFL